MVGDSIGEMVMKTFQMMELDRGINTTLFTLIPKVSWPTNIKEFIPISLFNVSYKIITMVFANRLKDIIPFLISNTQANLLKGRNI